MIIFLAEVFAACVSLYKYVRLEPGFERLEALIFFALMVLLVKGTVDYITKK